MSVRSFEWSINRWAVKNIEKIDQAEHLMTEPESAVLPRDFPTGELMPRLGAVACNADKAHPWSVHSDLFKLGVEAVEDSAPCGPALHRQPARSSPAPRRSGPAGRRNPRESKTTLMRLLAWTGRGHATDRAWSSGLAGFTCRHHRSGRRRRRRWRPSARRPA